MHWRESGGDGPGHAAGWGSRDAAFIALTAETRERLLAVAMARDSHVAVLLQGSGTFIVEAAITSLVPRDCLGGLIAKFGIGQGLAYLHHLGLVDFGNVGVAVRDIFGRLFHPCGGAQRLALS